MNDHPPFPKFFVEGDSGPLSYMQDPDVVPDQPSPAAPCPSSIIPNTQTNVESSSNSDLGDDAVFPTSVTYPLLRHRQHMRTERVQSAPTLMEHEVGLALRDISDDFNNSYIQVRADPTRRASHPGTNNNHSRGFIDGLRRQFSRRSRTSSREVDPRSELGAEVVHRPVTHSGSSVQSVPEDDEEADDVNSEASK